MGRSRLILAAVAMLLAASLPPPSGALPVTHGAVFIQDDAGFTAANGVVSGSGTPSDPYVFEGWHFVTNIGTAVIIRNTTASFVFRNNTFEATSGISISDSNGTIVIIQNRFVFRTTGIAVAHADAEIWGNTFIGDSASAGAGKGVSLDTSDSRVDGNFFLYVQFAVLAQRGSPTIRCNDMHDDVIIAGVTVKFTSNATIECNIMTRCNAGIEAESTIGTIVVNNTIDDCGVGIHLHLDKDFVAINNTVRTSWHDSVIIDTSTGVFSGNVVIDGRADGVVIYRSPILFANNTVSNHLDVGVAVSQTGGVVTANVIAHNSVGLALQGGAVPHVTANVLTNNSVGIDIPYASRQAIVNLSANLVNGVNIDGTLVPSERVYFYHAANVSIAGGVRDSGFSAGYYGSLTAQGNVVLYEVDTASVTATVIGHATFGVYAINSFNVVVQDSLIVQTGIGVYAAAVTTNGTGGVPPCAVSVKDTNITIPVDPVATVGIDVHACLGIVRNVTVSLVDTGIRFDQASRGTIEASVVSNTTVGFDLSGPQPLFVTGNVATNNTIGARFTASRAHVSGNTFARNADAGVQLYARSELDFDANLVTANGRAGLVDMQDCSARTTGGLPACSTLDAQANVFSSNGGVGLDVRGASTFRGDAFVQNAGDGARVASATLLNVNASGNGASGVRVTGDFAIRDARFENNTRHGLDASGGGELRRSVFSWNGEAGIHLRATYVQAFDLNVSHNFDGILLEGAPAGGVQLPPANQVGLNWILGLSPTQGNGPTPLDLHRSILVANERDAIRAGAALVNATSNYWGGNAPAVSIADQVGSFRNGVSPGVRFVPWYADEAMTMSEPVPLL